MSTTAWRKFGSSNDGLATKSTPFSTDDGEDSIPAGAGPACRTVKSPPSRKLAMALHAPVEPGAFEYSDVETENRDILHFSRLNWEILERLRLAASGVNSAIRRQPLARFGGGKEQVCLVCLVGSDRHTKEQERPDRPRRQNRPERPHE
jgi:hypothetical protein